MIQEYLALIIFLGAAAMALFALLRFIVSQIKNRQPECGSNCGCKTTGNMVKIKSVEAGPPPSGRKILDGLRLK